MVDELLFVRFLYWAYKVRSCKYAVAMLADRIVEGSKGRNLKWPTYPACVVQIEILFTVHMNRPLQTVLATVSEAFMQVRLARDAP